MTTDAATPEIRALGVRGPRVGAVGLGCMGMSQHYGRETFAAYRDTAQR